MNDAQSVANMNLISSLVWSMDSERPEYKALWWALPILKAWMTMRSRPSTSPGEAVREEESVALELERMAAERYAGSDAETLTTAAEMLRSPATPTSSEREMRVVKELADIRMRRIMQARPDESTPETAQRMASDLRQANALLRDADSTRLALSFVWPTMREMVGNRPDERLSDLLVRFVEAAKEERSAIRAIVKARDLETTPEAVQSLARSLSDAETCISEVRRLTNAESHQTTGEAVRMRTIELNYMTTQYGRERSLRPAIEAEYPEMRRIVGAKDGEGLLVALRRFAATWLQWEKDLREALKAKPGETVAEAARRTVEDAEAISGMTPEAMRSLLKALEESPMTEAESYAWAGQALRPLDGSGIEPHLYQQAADLVASAIRAAATKSPKTDVKTFLDAVKSGPIPEALNSLNQEKIMAAKRIHDEIRSWLRLARNDSKGEGLEFGHRSRAAEKAATLEAVLGLFSVSILADAMGPQ